MGKRSSSDEKVFEELNAPIITDTMKRAAESDKVVRDVGRRWDKAGKAERADFLNQWCRMSPEKSKELTQRSFSEFSRKEQGAIAAARTYMMLCLNA